MKKHQTTKHQNQLRIIGGKWRGRTFVFPPGANIRPTPNRVRETLFNWLSPVIHESRCLDLFAGSGSLGLEAFSRGTSSVTFIDNHREVMLHLQQIVERFAIQNAEIFSLTIPFVDTVMVKNAFDIVFIDPPFKENLIQPCCEWLENQQLLAKNAYIYIEAEKTLHPLPVPSHWELIKSKTAGQVGYHLLVRK